MPKATPGLPPWQGSARTPRGQRPRARAETSRTGTGRSRALLRLLGRALPQRASKSPRAYSDEPRAREVGSRRSTEEAAEQGWGEVPAAAEAVEGRLRAKGNAFAAAHVPADRAGSMTCKLRSRAYDRRHEAVAMRSSTNLLHHIYAVERLREAYYALRARCGRRGGRADLADVRAGAGSEPSGPVRPAGPRGLPPRACEAGVHRQGRREQASPGRTRAGGQDRPARIGRSP